MDTYCFYYYTSFGCLRPRFDCVLCYFSRHYRFRSAQLLYLVCSKDYSSRFFNRILSRFTAVGSRNRLTRRSNWISHWISNTGILYFILHNLSITKIYTHFATVCMIIYLYIMIFVFFTCLGHVYEFGAYLTLNCWNKAR